MKPETVNWYMEEAAKYLKENGFRDVIIVSTFDGKGDDASFITKCESGGQGLKLAAWLIDNCMDQVVNKKCDVYSIWKWFLGLLLDGIKKMEKETGVSGPNPFASPFPKD